MNLKSNSSVSFDQLQHLIACIYDAALDEKQWKNVLNTLTHTLHADRGSIRSINEGSKKVLHAHTFNVDPGFSQSYIDYYVDLDPWIEILLKSKETMFDCTHHLITDKEYKVTEYYHDYVLPQDHHYGIGGKINTSNNSISYLSFQRSNKRQGFENHYLDLLYTLAPHIKKAILINKNTRNLALEKNSFRDSLNQINKALLLVNKKGKVLFINSFAEEIIKLQKDFSIINNYFSIRSHENEKLQDLIYQATHGPIKHGGALCYIDSVCQSKISILVTPVNPDMINIDTQSSENALLVLSTNQQQKTIPVELLINLYNLTAAEARLTMYLCQGLTLDEISEKLILSKNTLRSQLRSSFNKTGTTRQAELINMIIGGPAGIIKTL